MHIYNADGSYNVKLSVSQGTPCVIQSTQSLAITTGIYSSYNTKELIQVYPNPANDVLYIKLVGLVSNNETNQKQELKTNIILYDMLGKNVYNTSTNGETLYSMSIGNLPKGVYILSVGSEKIKIVKDSPN